MWFLSINQPGIGCSWRHIIQANAQEPVHAVQPQFQEILTCKQHTTSHNYRYTCIIIMPQHPLSFRFFTTSFSGADLPPEIAEKFAALKEKEKKFGGLTQFSFVRGLESNNVEHYHDMTCQIYSFVWDQLKDNHLNISTVSVSIISIKQHPS